MPVPRSAGGLSSPRGRSFSPCWRSFIPGSPPISLLRDPCFDLLASISWLRSPCFEILASPPLLRGPCFDSHASRFLLRSPGFEPIGSLTLLRDPCFDHLDSSLIDSICWNRESRSWIRANSCDVPESRTVIRCPGFAILGSFAIHPPQL